MFEDLFAAGFDRAVIIGSDLPSLPARVLIDAITRLATPGRAVVGPSEDGGYYLLGLNRGDCDRGIADLFTDIRWSTPFALADTVAAAKRVGLEVDLGERWYDVDDETGLTRLRAELRDPAGAAAAPATAAVLERVFGR